MERPHVKIEPRQREVTGEILFLDQMRRGEVEATTYLELGDLAIQLYESEAEIYKFRDVRPDIMDEYEQYDTKQSETVASCIALADELLALKKPDSPLTFVDIVVDVAPTDVLAKLHTIAAGTILTGDDEQLAIPSNGEYYPVLDIRKQHAQLVGVGVRAWGWDDQKYVFTNEEGQAYEYPRHLLMYPEGEMASTRQLELTFGYTDTNAGSFNESVSLYLSSDGTARVSSHIWASAYAETGYEGHHGSSLPELTEDDVAAFGDLIAEVVGDTPESIGTRADRQLQEQADAAATPAARQAIRELIEATWTAQANYILATKVKGSDKTLGDQLADVSTADEAATKVNALITKWKAARQR